MTQNKTLHSSALPAMWGLSNEQQRKTQKDKKWTSSYTKQHIIIILLTKDRNNKYQ